ncbi:CHC2 zinc finger domain-containing protein [Chitinimonas sp. BJB300]|uniref:CHC2 zinc finger domain-containing protein n=2 Tax=Chitinimonas sp. BJB300 TaxID=1559339 RepID=UPI00118395DB|nr:CHC2 zinc finger domain-containing protein [Chitinimonas sp. BJB300]TSJ84654.1 toprim domain-containing protein [Chitinimonas sp. BJB300]
MARIPDTEIERLKAEVSLVRLIEADGIALRKQGKDYAACCPFHEDDKPSLVVTPSKNLFHCFGCGEAGGPIDWVMKRRGISFRHAAEWLRTGLGDNRLEPVLTPSSLAASPLAAESHRVDEAERQTLLGRVLAYYHDTLKQNPEVLAYLDKRGLNHPELIGTFQLGYANRTLGYRLPDKTLKAGMAVRQSLQTVGLLRESGHEHFNGSLVVPVIGLNGQIHEVYGRKIRTDLRAGTAEHLYLPGGHAGVWNEAGLAAAGGEVILCEALIDAMTFWVNGLRNVTASYGVNGFTADHLAAFERHAVKRVLIAYDHDEAGDKAALALAKQLQALGLDCWRIRFPHGLDANAYALAMKPAHKALSLVVRKAEWMGLEDAPSEGKQALAAMASRVMEGPAAAPPLPLAAGLPAVTDGAVPVTPPVAELPASPVPPAPHCDLSAEVNEREVVMQLGARRWRVRGLPKNLAVGVLKVNLMVSEGDDFHVDTLDLYAARARSQFLQQAAVELRASAETLKAELGRVLLKLEQVQDDTIQQALMPQVPSQPTMSEEEQQAALELLRAPDLLGRVLADFEQCGIVGEATNKLTAYLAATSRKLDRPLAVVVQSSSAAGKSSLMDAVLAFMPPEETVRYSAMSGQSLFYMGETNLKHKILAIAEEEGASRASYALKLLQSDGELTMASTGSDANGNLVAQEYRVEGPMSLFMTTTAIDIDEELLNRCLVLSVDEGREQTAAIHRRQRERRTLEGFLGKETKDAVLALQRNAQRLLRPLAVVNPFADQLTFLDDRTRTRRDHEKYLSLIDTIALLHQYQRPIKTLTVGDRQIEYVEVTPQDIAQANTLAHEVLGRSLDELPPQTRKLLIQVCEMVRARAAVLELPCSEYRFSRKVVRDATGWGDTQLKVHLARLAELEYLVVHRASQGQGYDYELLYDGDGRNAPYLSGLLDPACLYDSPRSGLEGRQSGDIGTWSVAGRGEVGTGSAPGQTDLGPSTPVSTRLIEVDPEKPSITRHPLPNAVPSYPQGVVAVEGAGYAA